MKHTPHIRTALAISLGLIVSSSVAAFAETIQLLVRAPEPSPYANCTLGSAPGTVVNPNSEVEPFVAANPMTLKAQSVNLIGVWQQDALSNGAARGGVAAFSFDTGKSWQEVTHRSAAARLVLWSIPRLECLAR